MRTEFRALKTEQGYRAVPCEFNVLRFHLGVIMYPADEKLRTRLRNRAWSALRMTKEQTMSMKFTKTLLAISLLASLVAMSATANGVGV
jgi:hypothetical protein